MPSVKSTENANTHLHPVPVPNNVMKQIGVDLSALPEANGNAENGPVFKPIGLKSGFRPMGLNPRGA